MPFWVRTLPESCWNKVEHTHCDFVFKNTSEQGEVSEAHVGTVWEASQLWWSGKKRPWLRYIAIWRSCPAWHLLFQLQWLRRIHSRKNQATDQLQCYGLANFQDDDSSFEGSTKWPVISSGNTRHSKIYCETAEHGKLSQSYSMELSVPSNMVATGHTWLCVTVTEELKF